MIAPLRHHDTSMSQYNVTKWNSVIAKSRRGLSRHSDVTVSFLLGCCVVSDVSCQLSSFRQPCWCLIQQRWPIQQVIYHDCRNVKVRSKLLVSDTAQRPIRMYALDEPIGFVGNILLNGLVNFVYVPMQIIKYIIKTNLTIKVSLRI